MASMIVPPANEKKRVKVYELKNNDWFDRGTGFCTGRILTLNGNDESRIYVESEDEPDRLLLETKIGKDDGYQRQADTDTLIVWTEQNGIDMALSFQEAEGCNAIWDFVSNVQQQLLALGPGDFHPIVIMPAPTPNHSPTDDALSDDAMDTFASNPLSLPSPALGNLRDIEGAMRSVATSPQGRDALAKFVISEDYIRKLIPLVEEAEDLEAINELHLLCNIMKMLILLNDSQIVDHIVNENVVFGVIGALEYDPDFPNHKANHRRYLKDNSRYKEVIKIADPAITKKIHATWRLTYLKDVVLARILDDPTFGVLNSLIFYNQVDIINHLQTNPNYLEELFGIIDNPSVSLKRKRDAVGFIQSCCAIAKSLQAAARANLYTIFINHGLLRVITFAILNQEAPLRVAGTDILVAMIDHDPSMVRAYILKSISEKKIPLTDTLIELLLVESDLGVKAQAADAIKVLLEPIQPQAQAQAQQAQAQDAMSRNGEIVSKFRQPVANPQTESYIHHFYDQSAKKLFQPMKDLERRETLNDLTFNDVQLFTHLIEIIMYLTRTHQLRSRRYLFEENLISRIAQLLTSPQKHLKLIALKFFRSCIGLQDEAYMTHFIQQGHFEPILDIVYTTMPRDNLLNSACLELFEFVRQTTIKPLIEHFALVHRAKLTEMTYVDIFASILQRYEQMNHQGGDMTLFSNDGEISEERRGMVNGNRWHEMKEMDMDQQRYFDTSDDEEDEEVDSPRTKRIKTSSAVTTNGLAPSPIIRSLVDYPDDDDDALESLPSQPLPTKTQPRLSPSPMLQTPPPERLSEKRRREDDDEEDELGKLSSSNVKRRTSNPSISSAGAGNTSPGGGNNTLRRKKGFMASSRTEKDDSSSPTGAPPAESKRKIAISFSSGAAAAAAKTPPRQMSEADGKEDDGG